MLEGLGILGGGVERPGDTRRGGWKARGGGGLEDLGILGGGVGRPRGVSGDYIPTNHTRNVTHSHYGIVKPQKI